MKTKKFFAALAACAMAAAVTGVVSFAAPLEEDAEEVEEDTVTEEEIIEEDDPMDEDFGDEDFGDEDFGDEDFGDEDFGDEDFGDDDTVDDTTAEDTTPDVVDNAAETSPKTGNAPVALAVIPVALAAAAVVAKKSK